MNDKYEAIAWLANIKEKYIHGGDEEFDECRRESIDMAIKALRQPQIVQCKDCKHWMSPGIGYKNADLGQCLGRGHGLKKSDWYCADGERR